MIVEGANYRQIRHYPWNCHGQLPMNFIIYGHAVHCCNSNLNVSGLRQKKWGQVGLHIVFVCKWHILVSPTVAWVHESLYILQIYCKRMAERCIQTPKPNFFSPGPRMSPIKVCIRLSQENLLWLKHA